LGLAALNTGMQQLWTANQKIDGDEKMVRVHKSKNSIHALNALSFVDLAKPVSNLTKC
jgi:hypothetical protein